MRIVVVGGSGLIGERLVNLLRAIGHTVVAAWPSSGFDAITGEGLAEALAGAQVVVDVTNTRSIEDRAISEFFVTVSRNLLAAGLAANVSHHVTLSIVGVDRLKDGAYFPAKKAQEDLVKASPIPYTIVRSTQFFELIERILEMGTSGDVVRLPPALIQPVASDDVAEALAEVAVAPPLNGTIEVAGPETICLSELARLVLSAHEDPRQVIADPHVCFFGTRLDHRSLIPGPKPRIGRSALRDWLRHYITAG